MSFQNLGKKWWTKSNPTWPSLIMRLVHLLIRMLGTHLGKTKHKLKPWGNGTNWRALAEGGLDSGSNPGLGRSPGGGHRNPPQYSSLENPMDRKAWWATAHGVAKSWTQLKQLSTHIHACARHGGKSGVPGSRVWKQSSLGSCSAWKINFSKRQSLQKQVQNLLSETQFV